MVDATSPPVAPAGSESRRVTAGVAVFVAAVIMEAVQVLGQASLLLADGYSGPLSYLLMTVAAVYLGLSLVVWVLACLLAAVSLVLCIADAWTHQVSPVTSWVTIVGSVVLLVGSPLTLGAASALSAFWSGGP